MVPINKLAGDTRHRMRSRVLRALRSARTRFLDRATGRTQPRDSPSQFPLRWVDDQTLAVDDLTFTLRTWGFESMVSHGRDFVLLKDRGFVEEYVRLFSGVPVTRVLEFGVYHGGHLLLMHKGFGASKVVGVDLRPQEETLMEYLRGAGLTDRVVPHFYTSQADRAAVTKIIEEDFSGREIDVVIDDASHDFALTREAFNIAFPYLKPGGLYIIEDWGWAHWRDTPWQTELCMDQPALSNLVFELAMACTSSREIIARVDVSPYLVAVRKGKATPDRTAFDLSNLYVARGKTLSLL